MATMRQFRACWTPGPEHNARNAPAAGNASVLKARDLHLQNVEIKQEHSPSPTTPKRAAEEFRVESLSQKRRRLQDRTGGSNGKEQRRPRPTPGVQIESAVGHAPGVGHVIHEDVGSQAQVGGQDRRLETAERDDVGPMPSADGDGFARPRSASYEPPDANESFNLADDVQSETDDAEREESVIRIVRESSAAAEAVAVTHANPPSHAHSLTHSQLEACLNVITSFPFPSRDKFVKKTMRKIVDHACHGRPEYHDWLVRLGAQVTDNGKRDEIERVVNKAWCDRHGHQAKSVELARAVELACAMPSSAMVRSFLTSFTLALPQPIRSALSEAVVQLAPSESSPGTRAENESSPAGSEAVESAGYFQATFLEAREKALEDERKKVVYTIGPMRPALEKVKESNMTKACAEAFDKDQRPLKFKDQRPHVWVAIFPNIESAKAATVTAINPRGIRWTGDLFVHHPKVFVWHAPDLDVAAQEVLNRVTKAFADRSPNMGVEVLRQVRTQANKPSKLFVVRFDGPMKLFSFFIPLRTRDSGSIRTAWFRPLDSTVPCNVCEAIHIEDDEDEVCDLEMIVPQ